MALDKAKKMNKVMREERYHYFINYNHQISCKRYYFITCTINH